MKRRVLALLVVTVMLVGMLPAMSGFAAFSPDTTGETTNINAVNWHWTYTNWGTGTHSFMQSNTVSRRGSSSLHLVHYDTVGSNEGDWTVRTHGNDTGITIGASGSEHKIGFWAKVNTLDKKENNAEADALQLRLGNVSQNIIAVGEPTNGWQYYENEFTANTNSQNGRWGFIVGDGNVDVYIDDVGFYKKDGDVWSENLLEASTSPTTFLAHFDTNTDMSVVDPFATPEPTATAAPFAPSAEGDSVKLIQQETKWDAGVPGGQAHTPNNYYGRINTAESHTGSGSLHIVNHDNPGTDSSNPAYTEYWILRPHSSNASALGIVAGTKHKVTFWAKVLTNDKMTNKATDDALQFRKNNTNVALSNMAVGTPVDGWQYYEHEFTENSAGRWGFIMSDGNVEAYIDDITFQTWNGSAYGDNLIAGDLALMGYFDDDSIPFEPSTDGDSAKTLQADTGYGWDVGVPGGQTTLPNNYSARINNTVSRTGFGSMHLINYDNTAGTGEWIRIAPHTTTAGSSAIATLTGTYKVSFWANVKTNDKQTGNAANDAFRVLANFTQYNLANCATGITDGDWVYYEKDITLSNGRWGFAITDGNVDVYIDDISLQLKDTTNNTYGENLLKGTSFLKKMAHFDTQFVSDDWAIKPSITKADGTKVSDVTADLSGATLSVDIAVANNSDAAGTCQMIVGVYNGSTMEKAVLSDILTATNGGASVNLEADIIMPTITEADAENYTIKIFVWDSVVGGNYLCSHATI